MKEIFENIPVIPYEGPQSKNPLATCHERLECN